MIKIPSRSYGALGTILELPGTEGLGLMMRDIVPVQDLSRVLMAAKVKRIAYELTETVAGTGNASPVWGDASTWTNVSVNGISTVRDEDLAQPNEERFITSVSLQIGGTVAHYTSLEVTRLVPSLGNAQIRVAEFGDLATSHATATPVGTAILPVALQVGETTLRLNQVVSGIESIQTFVIQLIAAPQGLLAIMPGA